MRNPIFISIFICFLIGCKEAPTLQITDLNFADIEKEYIAANQVDTTFLISPNPLLNFDDSDTFGYRTYDEMGNVLEERIARLGGHYLQFGYDSLGFVQDISYSTDYTARFKTNYKFVEDSLILYQFWPGLPQDTCVFKFDKTGRVLESVEHLFNEDSHGSQYKIVYDYSPSGRIIKISKNLLVSKEFQEIYESELRKGLSMRNVTDYFYTGDRLDSSITEFYYPNFPNENYCSKTYYDDNGLRAKTVKQDTLLIYYAHRTRNS